MCLHGVIGEARIRPCPSSPCCPGEGFKNPFRGSLGCRRGVLSPPKWGAGAEIPQLPHLPLCIVMCACKKSTP